MTTHNYDFNYTDSPGTVNFTVFPYTSNGPADPTTLDLHSNAVIAETSLIFVGKGFPEYGEIVQENILHLLENFSGTLEPTYPISGQLWFDTNVANLKVYDAVSSTWVAILQTNTGLPMLSDLDMGGFNIINLADPANPQDAMTFGFADTRYVNASGDTMTGNLTMGINNVDFSSLGGEVLGLPSVPSVDEASSSKKYVDDRIALVIAGAATNLGDLLDVDVTTLTPLTDDMLIFNGIDWVNIRPINSPYVAKSGGTMTGFLTLNADPINPLEAATKQYVDTSAAATDTYVDGATYDDTNGVLTLTRNAAADLIVGDFRLTDTLYINHEAKSFSPLNDGFQANLLDQSFFVSPSYPDMPLEQIIDEWSKNLVTTQSPNPRILLTTDGINSVYSLNGALYKHGYNELQIHINGIKQYASENGNTVMAADVPIFHTTPTGLLPATVYSFNISVDGAPDVLISVDTTFAPTQNFGWLKWLINQASVIAGAGFTANMHYGNLHFSSDIGGAGSSITITDIDLFSSLVGDGSYPIVVSAIGSWPNTVVLVDDSYWEVAGANGGNGEYSDTIEFHTIPVAGLRLEAIIFSKANNF